MQQQKTHKKKQERIPMQRGAKQTIIIMPKVQSWQPLGPTKLKGAVRE